MLSMPPVPEPPSPHSLLSFCLTCSHPSTVEVTSVLGLIQTKSVVEAITRVLPFILTVAVWIANVCRKITKT